MVREIHNGFVRVLVFGIIIVRMGDLWHKIERKYGRVLFEGVILVKRKGIKQTL